MKKISVALLVCSTLLFSACSNEKKAESDSTSKQETKVSSTEDSKEKIAEAKKQAEEAEKKKQEEIANKVAEADTAMKAAEANPTDETIAAAKSAIEAIPNGNTDLQKRLETATANLEAIKQQANQAQQQQVAEQAQQAQQQQTTDSGPTVITGAPPMTEQERQDREYYARLNEELARENGVDRSQMPQTPPTHVDDQGRQYIFENHDAYKDEPYYVGE